MNQSLAFVILHYNTMKETPVTPNNDIKIPFAAKLNTAPLIVDINTSLSF